MKKTASKSDLSSRSPRGERGLKLLIVVTVINVVKSLPARGAWIEIDSAPQPEASVAVAPREGSVD